MKNFLNKLKMKKNISTLTFSVGVIFAFIGGFFLRSLVGGPTIQPSAPNDSGQPPSTSVKDKGKTDPSTGTNENEGGGSDLQVKEGVFPLLAGTIQSIEQKGGNKTIYKVDLEEERSFKNGDELNLKGSFVTNAGTNYVKYVPSKDSTLPIVKKKINEGDHVLLYTQEKITAVTQESPLTLVKIMKD